jgi:hypothetical protein
VPQPLQQLTQSNLSRKHRIKALRETLKKETPMEETLMEETLMEEADHLYKEITPSKSS